VGPNSDFFENGSREDKKPSNDKPPYNLIVSRALGGSFELSGWPRDAHMVGVPA
jgi:hypothetical protein